MKLNFPILGLLILLISGCQENTDQSAVEIGVLVPENNEQKSIDGRLLIIFAKNDETEPRFQINGGLKTQVIFGMNIENHVPGQKISFDNKALGFPVEQLSGLQEGDYYVQALLHVYETFQLSTGHTVKLPMDNGEGQQWNRSPGNLYSKPFKVNIGKNGLENFELSLDQSFLKLRNHRIQNGSNISNSSQKNYPPFGGGIFILVHISFCLKILISILRPNIL